MSPQQVDELRLATALSIGIYMPDGTPNSYSNLTPANQIRLTDAMAKVIASDPDKSKYTPVQVQLANNRVASPIYGQPMENTSMISIAADMAASGELQAAMFQGASGYTSALTNKALMIGGAVLLLWLIINTPDTLKKWTK